MSPRAGQPSIDVPRLKIEFPSFISQWAIFPFDIVNRYDSEAPKASLKNSATFSASSTMMLGVIV
jgi:hypothetical protein